MSEFTGFPEAALDFYDDLEMDNTKSFWEAHKAVWTESVKAPMVALTDALAAEFGTAKVFRPLPRRAVRQGEINSSRQATSRPRSPCDTRSPYVGHVTSSRICSYTCH